MGVGGSVALPAAALLVVFAFGRGLVSRLLSLRPFVLLGEISYSLYLLHATMIGAFVQAFPDLSAGVTVISASASILAASPLCWLAVERPMRGLIMRGPARTLAGSITGTPPAENVDRRPQVRDNPGTGG